ncbi:gem-associated protein 2-like [Stegodyphus dumicola]|uniref:gem-associated protein 2-like n=1 Tax=Stegodyphus dumicola TaxID=202533 RepID=UPI0015A90FDF|nr:gem-associated protein 2-like [Stegodyphus dumicola]
MVKCDKFERVLKPAFDLRQLPRWVNLNAAPMDGLDYLYRVRLEATKYPEVAVSDMDTTQFAHLQNFKVEKSNEFIIAKPGFAPNHKLQKAQLDLFLRQRRRILKNRALLKRKFPRGVVPKPHKKEAWKEYCLGPEKLDEDTDVVILPESSVCEPTAENKEFHLNLIGKPPLLSVVVHLNQRVVIKLLSYHKDWLEEGAYTHDNGVWLYSLLACLEKPLYPDTHALLRSISRLCSSFRAEITDPESDILKSLNLIISIIAYCFDQKDMSDDFAL